MNLSLMESLTRSTLNELSQVRLPSPVIQAELNSGYRDVASKAFCIEHIDTLVVLPLTTIIPFTGHRVNKLEYLATYSDYLYHFQDYDYLWTDGDYLWNRITLTSFQKLGMTAIHPSMSGHLIATSPYPQYWFQWGNYIILDPAPSVILYLSAYIDDYPSATMTSSSTPSDLPYEFHPSIMDFALYTLSIRLRKWDNAVYYYNRYLFNLSRRRIEYLSRTADKRSTQRLPDNVLIQESA
jgi:hypothetical protein